jgi:hypothetical protein
LDFNDSFLVLGEMLNAASGLATIEVADFMELLAQAAPPCPNQKRENFSGKVVVHPIGNSRNAGRSLPDAIRCNCGAISTPATAGLQW